MPFFASRSRLWALPLFLFAGSCMNEPEETKPIKSGPSSGTFRVSLSEPAGTSLGTTSIEGKVYAGELPSALAWVKVEQAGSCILYTPNAPFCETFCGSGALCVADNTCKAFPKSIPVGTITVSGVKRKGGGSSFAMSHLLNNYQPGEADSLAFPPFAEGDLVSFSAAGDTALAAFKVTAPGIAALKVLNDSITLADGKAISLKWTAAAKAGASVIGVMVDISHHGGTKGKIECEGPDNGSMEIAATLVDKLKALGVSGFPKIELKRKSTGTNAEVNVSLVLESEVYRSVEIPGLISCSGDEDCPGDQTCQPDLQCKLVPPSVP